MIFDIFYILSWHAFNIGVIYEASPSPFPEAKERIKRERILFSVARVNF